MAQLPPSAVFGSARPGQAVHVLLLIENSLPMIEHWQDLQQHILPGVLGAVRIANPGINVEIFWETTGKTQDQRPAYKTQRHFNDFPDIDIVGLPRNKLSPLFIRQSIDLFLSGDNPKMPITRHLFIVAMSNPIDNLPGNSDNPQQQAQTDDAKWDELATKLQENKIFLHVIANPLVRLARIFEVFRKTMRFQSRQEVIPWQPVDSTHCICHLSGSPKHAEKHDHLAEEWPEVHLPSADPPSPVANSPTDMSDDELPSPISPIDMINSNPGSLSLVSRMQALHGLASRRRLSERSRRPSISRSSFFRETSPTPSPRREWLVNSKINNSGNGAGKEKERLRQLSIVAVPPTRPPASFSSALDLRGLTQDPVFRNPADAPYAGGPAGGYAGAGPAAASGTDVSPPAMAGFHPSSPNSDASGSTMSSSIPSISSVSHRNIDMALEGPGSSDAVQSQSAYVSNRSMQPPLYPLKVGSSSQLASYQMMTGPASPNGPDVVPPLSPTLFQSPTQGPLPYSAYASPSIPSFPSYMMPYPPFAPAQPTHPSYVGRTDTITSHAHLPSLAEGDSEPEIVPASAPPDVRGQVPFVFDATYEAQNIIRLRHAMDSMQERDDVQHTPGAGGPSELANGNWKGHGSAQTSSYIPELPDAFYSVDRGRYDERQFGSYFSSSGTGFYASSGL